MGRILRTVELYISRRSRIASYPSRRYARCTKSSTTHSKNVHVTEEMSIYGRCSLNDGLGYRIVPILTFKMLPEKWQDISREQLFQRRVEQGIGKCLSYEGCTPSTDFKSGAATDDGEDAAEDLGVMGCVGEYKLAGLLEPRYRVLNVVGHLGEVQGPWRSVEAGGSDSNKGDVVGEV